MVAFMSQVDVAAPVRHSSPSPRVDGSLARMASWTAPYPPTSSASKSCLGQRQCDAQPLGPPVAIERSAESGDEPCLETTSEPGRLGRINLWAARLDPNQTEFIVPFFNMYLKMAF